jgi:protein O-mannosyl-transferase
MIKDKFRYIVAPKFIFSVLILLITFMVYSNTFQNDFVNWDDNNLIVNNLKIRSLSFDNIKQIFAYRSGATYQPIRVLSYAIDYHFWGLDPAGYHLQNIFFHGFAAVFLFLFLVRFLPKVTGYNRKTEIIKNEPQNNCGFSPMFISAIWIAFFTALLFAVHPINVESVAWLSGRKYVLLGFFSFLSLYLFIRTIDSSENSFWLQAGTYGTFLLAAFSSPFGVVIPLLHLLVDYATHDGNIFSTLKKRFKFYIPYIVLFSMVLVMLLTTLIKGTSIDHFQGNINYTIYSMLQGLFDYTRNFLFPFWLNIRYVDYIYLSPLHMYKIPVAFFALILLSVFAIYQLIRGKRFIFFCCMWFVVFWLPASNIIPISTKMADRYVYLAGAGFFLLLTGSIRIFCLNISKIIFKILPNKHWDLKLFSHIFMGIIMIMTVGSFSILAYDRNKIWENSGTLWKDSLSKNPDNYLAHSNLGVYLYYTGKNDEAIKHFTAAIALEPKAEKALSNLGDVYMSIGENDKALQVYKKILSLGMDEMEMFFKIGKLLFLQGKYEEALSYFKRLLSKNGIDIKALNFQGNIYRKMGENDLAKKSYMRGLAADPDNPDVLYNMGDLYLKMDLIDEAQSYFYKVLELDPDHAEANNGMGLIRERQKRFDEAIIYYEKAIHVKGTYAIAQNNLGNAFLSVGEFDKAEEAYLKTLEIDPEYVDALYNIGLLFEKKNQISQAIESYQEAIEKDPYHKTSLNNVGSLYLNKGKNDKAIESFKKALEIDRGYIDAKFNLGVALAASGQNDEALSQFYEIVMLNQDDWDSHHYIGMLLAKNKKFQQAVAHYTKILPVLGNQNNAWEQYCVILIKLNRFQEAATQLRKLLDSQPENKSAQTILSYVEKVINKT